MPSDTLKWGKGLALLIIFLLVSCGGGDSTAPTDPNAPDDPPIDPPPFLGGNNRGNITGDQLGTGTKLNKDLVKRVSVSHSFLGNFDILSAYITTSRSYGFDYFIQIKNYGPSRCLIKLVNIQFKNISNQVLLSEDNFVTGSFDGSTTNTCLAENEEGYVLGITSNVDPANVVTINIGDYSEGYPPKPTDISWKPLSYNIVSTTSFIVTIINNSPNSHSTSLYNKYVLLDDDNTPLDWGFLDDAPSTAPGNTAQLLEDLYFFDGVASKMEVFIE